MTRSLKKAFEAASKLPEAEQDALAAAILEELESERRWDELFQRSADTLAKLAKQALTPAFASSRSTHPSPSTRRC